MRHNIEEVRNTYRWYIEDLINEGMLEACDNECDFEEWINNIRCNLKYDIDFASGCSRIVFWIASGEDAYQYVFKFDYNTDDEYCKNELTNYQHAIKEGVDDYFAWCDLFGTYSDGNTSLDIYVMEYCEMAYEAFSEIGTREYDDRIENELNLIIEEEGWDRQADEEAIDEARGSLVRSIGYYSGDDSQIIETILPYYMSYQEVERLAQFLNEYNINDCHGGNFGFIGGEDGRVVLTDYAGF